MLGQHTLSVTINELRTWVDDWAVASQQQARRNAMVATTACAQRRSEREDVEDFLAAQHADDEPFAEDAVDAVERAAGDATT